MFSFGKFLDRKSHLPKQLSYPLTEIRISTIFLLKIRYFKLFFLLLIKTVNKLLAGRQSIDLLS